MDDRTTKFTVFYSWQTDISDASNRKLIRQCLRDAANSIESTYPGLILDIDEATRNMSGSPNIPETILAKIRTADAFICDVTTINSESNDTRKTPNPNVTFELGYAVATLGWERVILLFNSAFGSLQDLPFDFDRHRASPFRASNAPTDKDKERLVDLLTTAITLIITSNPIKPIQEQSDEQRKHSRDVVNVNWIMTSIHLPTLDEFINDSPHRLSDTVLYFSDNFISTINSSLFHLYDSELMESLVEFRDAFYEATRHWEFYHPNGGRGVYVFLNPGDRTFSNEQQGAWDSIVRAKHGMREALGRILAQVRERFLEVDIERASSEAWHTYANIVREHVE